MGDSVMVQNMGLGSDLIKILAPILVYLHDFVHIPHPP